jgi:hypothetical protein
LQIPDATDPAALADLQAGAWTSFQTTLTDLGSALEAHLSADLGEARRATLAADREQRACGVALADPTSPLYPDLACDDR